MLCAQKSLYQRPGAGAKHIQSSSKTFGVSEVKLDSGLVHGAAQKSAALVCLIGIGKINLYNLHLSPCHLLLPVDMGRLGQVQSWTGSLDGFLCAME